MELYSYGTKQMVFSPFSPDDQTKPVVFSPFSPVDQNNAFANSVYLD